MPRPRATRRPRADGAGARRRRAGPSRRGLRRSDARALRRATKHRRAPARCASSTPAPPSPPKTPWAARTTAIPVDEQGPHEHGRQGLARARARGDREDDPDEHGHDHDGRAAPAPRSHPASATSALVASAVQSTVPHHAVTAVAYAVAAGPPPPHAGPRERRVPRRRGTPSSARAGSRRSPRNPPPGRAPGRAPSPRAHLRAYARAGVGPAGIEPATRRL